MEQNFTIGNLSVAPNSKVQTWLPVINSKAKLPVTLINGAMPGKTVLITAGTHGGEYPGIEAAIRLAKTIDPAEVTGRIAIISCINQESFFAKMQYYNPIDGINLNRVFPGKAMGSFTERLAYTVSSLFFSQADYFMDLHSGDIHENLIDFVIYPGIGSEEQKAKSREMASLLGVPHVVTSASTTGSVGAAAEMGASALLGEIGCCGRWSEESVGTYVEGLKNIMRYLGVLPGEVKRHACVYYKRMASINAPTTGVWHPAVVPGQVVKEGDFLGEIVDLFGNVLEKVNAPISGPMLYVVSSLSVREGEALYAIGDPE